MQKFKFKPQIEQKDNIVQKIIEYNKCEILNFIKVFFDRKTLAIGLELKESPLKTHLEKINK